MINSRFRGSIDKQYCVITMKLDKRNAEILGLVIQFHRKAAGLSRNELAAIAGIGKTAIFDMEKGKATIQLSTLLKMLDALNITVRLNSPLMARFQGSKDAKS
jgi:HTH-type transcriptional regulator / antitoxin HipB